MFSNLKGMQLMIGKVSLLTKSRIRLTSTYSANRYGLRIWPKVSDLHIPISLVDKNPDFFARNYKETKTKKKQKTKADKAHDTFDLLFTK